MSTIKIDNFSAWVTVDTLHKHNLEFVLMATEARIKRRNYVENLWDMLEKEFKCSQCIRLVEYGVYGDVSLRVEAFTIKQLEKALNRCEKVVKRWINKYNINSMKLDADGV